MTLERMEEERIFNERLVPPRGSFYSSPTFLFFRSEMQLFCRGQGPAVGCSGMAPLGRHPMLFGTDPNFVLYRLSLRTLYPFACSFLRFPFSSRILRAPLATHSFLAKPYTFKSHETLGASRLDRA